MSDSLNAVELLADEVTRGIRESFTNDDIIEYNSLMDDRQADIEAELQNERSFEENFDSQYQAECEYDLMIHNNTWKY